MKRRTRGRECGVRRESEIVRKLTIAGARKGTTPTLRVLPPLYRAGHAAASLIRGVFEEVAPVGGGLLLLELAREEGLTPAALARALGLRRPSVTPMIALAYDHGLIDRELNPLDRRSWRLHLTRGGAGIVKLAWARVRHIEQRIERGLTEADLESLSRVVNAVVAEKIAPTDLD